MFGNERTIIANGTPRGEAIARLNDQLRKTLSGGHIMVTRGARGLRGFTASELAQALAAHNTFDVQNDPLGERDFGDLELFGATLLWKIDYYDPRLEYASSDPADPQQTVRVLTVMLETEY
jgi:hypothetical protein